MMTKISGGFTAYREAVRRAYREPMHNPCVRWSLRRGFTAESILVPADDDQYTLGAANYDANTGGQWVPDTHSEYAIVRRRLLAFQATLDEGGSRDQANEAASDAAWEYEMAH